MLLMLVHKHHALPQIRRHILSRQHGRQEEDSYSFRRGNNVDSERENDIIDQAFRNASPNKLGNVTSKQVGGARCTRQSGDGSQA